MKKYFLIILLIPAGILGYIFIPGLTNSRKQNTTERSKSESRMLPKVLFLTTGINEGNGAISQGVVIAIQSFSKNGAFVWLDSRDLLMQPDLLSEYSIMVIATSVGYHDGDRQYSLTFMSDIEMQNIINWVENGGILIAEENIGRNTLDEIDRVEKNGKLDQSTWKLSKLFGVVMRELDINGFSIEEKDAKIWNGTVKEKSTEDEWALIPTEIISEKITVLAEWTNGSEKYPAIIMNDYGKGKAILLSSTYLLHPKNDGGFSSIEQIENFYSFILSIVNQNNKFVYELNPWPNGNSTAFCISFTSEGDAEKYKRIISFLQEEKLSATFFIDSSLNEEEKKILEENKNIILQSNLCSKSDLSGVTYSEIKREILTDEQKNNKNFSGLRFPQMKPNFWGLLFADEKGYVYESSIRVDHLTSYTGSVIPYNIPISQNSFYKTLKMLEISPVSNDDKFYFQKTEAGKDYFEDEQRHDANLFEKYLMDFYNYVVLKNNGVMVYAGSPEFTGNSGISLQPLKKLVDTLKTKNCWMTTLEEVANYKNKFKDLSVEVTESDNGVDFKIHLPKETTIKDFSFKLKSKPAKVSATGNNNLKEINGVYYLVTDVKDGDVIVMNY